MSNIEWTDRTWNPVTGCTKVSAACKHCYAEGVAHRFWHTLYDEIPTGRHDASGSGPETRPRLFTDVQTHEDKLLAPLSWRKPSRVFVNSMSDLFHEDVPDTFIDAIFGVMAAAGRHTFQVLTKRPHRMLAYFANLPERVNTEWGGLDQLAQFCLHRAWKMAGLAYGYDTPVAWPLPNVWLGVSVEDQATADARIPLLLQTPAAVRFISAEPLLGPIRLFGRGLPPEQELMAGPLLNGGPRYLGGHFLDWVIVGGESGPKARVCQVGYIESIVEQCRTAGVRVFVKQLGAKPAMGVYCDDETESYPLLMKLRDRKGGDPSEWPEDLRVRQFPEAL